MIELLYLFFLALQFVAALILAILVWQFRREFRRLGD